MIQNKVCITNIVRKIKRVGAKVILNFPIFRTRMFSTVRDIFIQGVENYDFVICKTEKRIDDNFPTSFIIPTEVDILMHEDDIDFFAKYLENTIRNKLSRLYSIQKVNGNKRKGVILYCLGYEIIYFDLQTTENFSLSKQFNERCIDNRVLSRNEEYFVSKPEYEIIIRASEYIKNNQKKWHKEYIVEHINDFDESLLNIAIEDKQSALYYSLRNLIIDVNMSDKNSTHQLS